MKSSRTPGSARDIFGTTASAQRRFLTIVFSDLSESTHVAGTMEAEDYADFLGMLRRIFTEVVARHGGEIVRIDGDGVAVIFGHPNAHEDDGRRATEAAIDLHAAAARLGREIPSIGAAIRLHTGIHSGLVLVDEGDLIRGRFEMLGDATNVASRLSGLAKADEIVVTEETLGPERHFFRTSERRQVVLRGRDRPVVVFSVLGRDVTENRFAARGRRGFAPFVGREVEFVQLRKCLGDVLAGQSRLAVLAGPTGLGKTRLANEFLAEAANHGFRVHRGYCESYLGARTLQPFVQLLQSIFQIDPATTNDQASELLTLGVGRVNPGLSGRLDGLRRLLALHAGVADESSQAGPTAVEAAVILRDLFERLALAGPVVLFIDDWQWADDVSRHVLDDINSIENRSIFLLLATREYSGNEMTTRGAEVIQLSPLTVQECEATIGAMLHAPEPFVVSRIAQYSGGNPLFIEELCHSMSHGGAAQRPDGAGAWLDALIESRLARLSEEYAGIVRAASVIGYMMPAWLFEEITGLREDHPAVLDLANLDFIYKSEFPGTLRFKHGITRDAIYQTVGLRERRSLHVRVVQALHRHVAVGGEEEPFEALAYHYGAAGDPAKAAHFAEVAGDRALAASSLDRAQAQFRAALAALDMVEQTEATLERKDAIVRKFGIASAVDPAREHLAVFQRAVAGAVTRGDTRAGAWAELLMGQTYYGLGESRKSILHCESALQAANASNDEKLAGHIRATLGQAHAAACEYGAALVLLDQTIDLKRKYRSRAQYSVSLAYSLSCKAFLLADQGRFEAAYVQFDEAIAALGGAFQGIAASILNHRSAACLWQGRMDEAIAYAIEGGRIGEQIKSRYHFNMARALGAFARWSIDGSADAVATLVEVTTWFEASDSRQYVSLNHGWLTEVMVAIGREDEARRHAARALLRARQGDRLGEAMAMRALARGASMGQGRHSPDYYLDRAMISARARDSAQESAKTQVCAAEIAIAAGDRTAAATLMAQARPALTAMGMEWYLMGSA